MGNGRIRILGSVHLSYKALSVPPKNQKNFKISRHLEFYGICMKH